MSKGQEKSNKNNKQKLTTKEKAEKKKAKKEGKKWAMLKTIVSFLTNEECEEFVSLIDNNNQRSSMTGEEKYIRIINNSRTSNTSFLSNKNNLVSLIKQRIAQQIGVDINKLETLQGVKYQSGQYFAPHHDGYSGIRKEKLTKESGNRVWTFLIYLNDDFEGGETNFPKLNYEIKPKIFR